jgi:hypothetical protein
MKNIHELVTDIRALINGPRKQAALLREHKIWGMLCSSLDVIGDTECALAAYLAGSNSQGDKNDPHIESGNLYLTFYGVLQVLFVQDDAVKHLYKSLGFTRSPNSTVDAIRETRNDAVGHPTNRDRERGKKVDPSFFFISRPTLSRWGCQLLTFRSDGTSDFRSLHVRKMVEDQREAVKTWLNEVITHLKAQEMAHREQFKGKKLTEAFPETIGYYHEKISETIAGTGQLPRSSGAELLELIRGAVELFKAELAARGAADAFETVNRVVEEIAYPMGELLGFLQNAPESTLNEKDAEIFHFYLYNKIKQLISMAREIDADYEATL